MAIRTIRLPDVGEGVAEAEITEILVNQGDLVREDDPIAAVMTDKATVEITSAYSGKVIWIGGEVGKTLAIGSDLFRIEDDSADNDLEVLEQTTKANRQHAADTVLTKPVTPSKACPLKADADKKVDPVPSSAMQPVVTIPPRIEGAPVLASPAVRMRAREAGIDLRVVCGSGPAGRISHADLDHLFQQAGQSSPPSSSKTESVETVKVVGLRRMIAKRMSEANAAIPHITVVEEVDVTEIEVLRQKMNESRGDRPKLTILPLIAAALVKAKESCPKIFARYDDVAEEIQYSTATHIGIATMTEAGLMVPVVRNAQASSPFALAAEISRLSEACRDGKAKREELSGSTITITSLGPLGAIATTPIINKPEVAILGVNRMAVRPSWNGSAFVPRTMMNISASFDHRIIDGWDAAVFVQRMKVLLETPALIFMKD